MMMRELKKPELERIEGRRENGLIGYMRYMSDIHHARYIPDYYAYSISDILENYREISSGESVYVKEARAMKMDYCMLILHDFTSDIDVYTNPDSVYRSTMHGMNMLKNMNEAVHDIPDRCWIHEIVLRKNDCEKLFLYSFDMEARLIDLSEQPECLQYRTV